MCGASDEQKQMQQEQLDFYKQAEDESRATFGEQQGILSQLQDVYKPILQRGPNAKGFSDAQRNDLNATVVDGTARNYGQAARAVNRNIAAQGGAPGMTTGAQMQLKSEVGDAAAEQESSEQSQVLQSDYAQGYNEFQQATNALSEASGQLSPTSYLNAATSAGTAASDTADRIAQENDSWLNAAIGAAGTIGGDALMCPAEGSRILMADGKEKPVEQIAEGDQVRGIDGLPQRVLNVESEVCPVFRVRRGDLDVRVTGSHAFVLVPGGYERACDCANSVPDGEARIFAMFLDGSHTYRANGFWSLSD